MIEIRRDAEIYAKEGGWFSARWHFSFDEYFDPGNMGFGTLRVFNDDRLIPGAVWPLHLHATSRGSPTSWKGRSGTRTTWAGRRGCFRRGQSSG